MLKTINILLVACVLVVSCTSYDRPKKPDNLISKDSMEYLIYDLYVLNAAKSSHKLVLKNNYLVPETYILNKYNIDSLQFAESNTYYAFDPEVYGALVDKVNKRLLKEKDIYEAIKKVEEKKDKEEKKKRDSLKPKKKTAKKKQVPIVTFKENTKT